VGAGYVLENPSQQRLCNRPDKSPGVVVFPDNPPYNSRDYFRRYLREVLTAHDRKNAFRTFMDYWCSKSGNGSGFRFDEWRAVQRIGTIRNDGCYNVADDGSWDNERNHGCHHGCACLWADADSGDALR